VKRISKSVDILEFGVGGDGLATGMCFFVAIGTENFEVGELAIPP